MDLRFFSEERESVPGNRRTALLPSQIMIKLQNQVL